MEKRREHHNVSNKATELLATQCFNSHQKLTCAGIFRISPTDPGSVSRKHHLCRAVFIPACYGMLCSEVVRTVRILSAPLGAADGGTERGAAANPIVRYAIDTSARYEIV